MDNKNEFEDIAKFTIKDSIFTNMFRIKKYARQLYLALHPEDTFVTEDDIFLTTIENVFMVTEANDFGLRVNDKLMILTEAQSDWSANILLRMFFYMADSYSNYYKESGKSLHSTSKLVFPKPELYIIYTGVGHNKETISLSEEYLNGEESALEVKAKVIKASKDGDIIDQYIKFTKVYDEQRSTYGRTRKAVLETIRICKDKNLLKEYLMEHEKEAVSIMMAINDVQYNFNAYLNEYGDQKMAEGLAEGIGKGRAEGLAEGLAEGIGKGRAEGEENKLLENIKSVMEGLDMPLEEVLGLLKVPKSDYEKYKKLIK